MDQAQAGSDARKVGLPRVQIPFHSSLRLAGKEPLFPGMSSQLESSPPAMGKGKQEFFAEDQRWTKWSVSSIAFWLVLPQASLTSFPFLEKGVCAWCDSFCVPCGPVVRVNDPFYHLPSSLRIQGHLKNPPASQSQAGNSVTLCRWGK